MTHRHGQQCGVDCGAEEDKEGKLGTTVIE